MTWTNFMRLATDAGIQETDHIGMVRMMYYPGIQEPEMRLTRVAVRYDAESGAYLPTAAAEATSIIANILVWLPITHPLRT